MLKKHFNIKYANMLQISGELREKSKFDSLKCRKIILGILVRFQAIDGVQQNNKPSQRSSSFEAM